MNKLRHIIEDNWDEIRKNIKSKWNKLTDNDLDNIAGSYDELTDKLHKLYGYKIKEIEKELNDFFESSEFDKIKSKAENKFNTIKNIVWSALDEYFQVAKEKSINTEKVIVEYTKENPFKFIALAATAGLLIGYLCNHNKN